MYCKLITQECWRFVTFKAWCEVFHACIIQEKLQKLWFTNNYNKVINSVFYSIHKIMLLLKITESYISLPFLGGRCSKNILLSLALAIGPVCILLVRSGALGLTFSRALLACSLSNLSCFQNAVNQAELCLLKNNGETNTEHRSYCSVEVDWPFSHKNMTSKLVTETSGRGTVKESNYF